MAVHVRCCALFCMQADNTVRLQKISVGGKSLAQPTIKMRCFQPEAELTWLHSSVTPPLIHNIR